MSANGPGKMMVPARPVSYTQFGKEVSMAKTRKVHRSAETGEFVKESEVKRHPKTTVTETVKVPSKKK